LARRCLLFSSFISTIATSFDRTITFCLSSDKI
jgi:hypothetical protein